MDLFGKQYSTDQLRKRVGRLDQVAGIRLVELADGRGRPARAALFHTGSGLEFTVALDRCMDIAAASYCGRAMGWRSTVGDVAPQYYEPEGLRWLHTATGGLLCTCGLVNVGVPGPDSATTGEGLHGRIGATPAENVQVVQEWQGRDYVLSVTGTMRETSLLGVNFTLRRTVSTRLGDRSFRVDDVLTNEGFEKAPFMLLYHCNIGWPAVDEGSRVLAPSRHVAPRDDVAAAGVATWNAIEAPRAGYAEQVFYHDMAPARGGTVTCAVVNDGFKTRGGDGFGVYVRYDAKNLPRFTHWKQMGAQAYVVGLEPCNCGVHGREADEREGLLHSLKAGASLSYGLEFGPLTSRDEVAAIEKEHAGVETHHVESYREFVTKPGRRKR